MLIVETNFANFYIETHKKQFIKNISYTNNLKIQFRYKKKLI